MSNDRINEFITPEKNDIIKLMSWLDAAPQVIDFVRMDEGMGNTGYKVTTASGIYLLKLYSNPSHGIECAMYRYLNGKVKIPTLYYYNGSKQTFPFAYTVTEYIDGITLAKRLKNTLSYPPNFAYEAGRICAVIHKRKYPCDALLDVELNASQKLPKTREKILLLLDGKLLLVN